MFTVACHAARGRAVAAVAGRSGLSARTGLKVDWAAFADAYAALHPDARGYLNLPDFQFYRLRVERP